MVFTDKTWRYFSRMQHRIRSAMVQYQYIVPFKYEKEPFFKAYEALTEIWVNRHSKRNIADTYKMSKEALKKYEENFTHYGAVGLLPNMSFLDISYDLEQLAILVKTARPHERANYTLKLARILKLPNAKLDNIRLIQRCYGYGHRMDENDLQYYSGLQHILNSVEKQQKRKKVPLHSITDRPKSFFNYDRDHLQQRVELFKKLSLCRKKRMIRPILKEFGMAPNRFYVLKNRYMRYGVWGLVDLIQKGCAGEKISPEVELQIIEERLMNPSLSTAKMIGKLNLKCSRANVQKIYSKWKLSKFKDRINIRGVLPQPIPVKIEREREKTALSAKSRFPDLIENSRLKVNHSFERLVKQLRHRNVSVSNPGAMIVAPFLEQLGVVESLHTYGPEVRGPCEITNNIIVNVLRIIAGFPTINDYTINSDRSVALASGLALNPLRSRFYDSFDDLRFEHLQNLRNDASLRAKELGIFDGKEIAFDYHCDSSDSRFPHDKSLSKSPDKNGNMVYAHRPQIIWDSTKNTIINIAYCEGQSRAPSALYKFCEHNLFKIIDPQAIAEIYADSEYTGEKQLVYLSVFTDTNVTMCLKQNPKIKKWKEQSIQTGAWSDYGKDYRIVSKDFTLAETKRPFRFVVKQHKETEEVRCFGSTHVNYSPKKILDLYHIRWPVETGIKDLIQNYYLDKPPGTSPERAESHYYCVMLARLTIDYFKSMLMAPQWRMPEDWESVLSTIRTSVFSNQNCQLSLNESGDFLLTYLDGDHSGIITRVQKLLKLREEMNLNRVSWWGGRGIQIEIKNQYDF